MKKVTGVLVDLVTGCSFKPRGHLDIYNIVPELCNTGRKASRTADVSVLSRSRARAHGSIPLAFYGSQTLLQAY